MGLILFLSYINLFDTEIEMMWIEGGKRRWEGPWRRRVRENHKKIYQIEKKKNDSQLKGKKKIKC